MVAHTFFTRASGRDAKSPFQNVVKWRSLHGYATINSRLESPTATSALNGTTMPVGIRSDSVGTVGTSPPQTSTSA